MRNFERSATLLSSSPTLRKIPRAPRLAHNLLLCRLRRSKHRNELRISHDDRLLQFWEKKTKTPHYLTFSQNLSYFIFQTFPRSGKLVRQFQDVFKNPRLPSIGKSGCISWNPDYGFAIERVKRISLPRNPSSKWISIMKSKSGYFAFLSLPLVWEIRKNGFAKLSREQWSFFCYNYDCELETVVQRWNPLSDYAVNWKSETRISKSESRFPNRKLTVVEETPQHTSCILLASRFIISSVFSSTCCDKSSRSRSRDFTVAFISAVSTLCSAFLFSISSKKHVIII